ncbi:MAG: hypothetical protein HOP19_24770 [Acidobacteria bacterium]|nr:hypothetical protein [Acidobacteriota bacterium]
MKKHFGIVCLALLLSATAFAQTKNFQRTVEFAPGGDLRVNTDLGTLRLTAWDRPEVEVVARISGREGNGTSAEDMRRSVELTQIEVTGGDGQPLSIRANYDGGNPENKKIWISWNRHPPFIEWEIRAPRQLNLTLDVDRSETAEVRGFEGRHVLNSDRTALRLDDLSGDLRLDIDRGQGSQLNNVRGKLMIEADRTNLSFERLQLTGDSKVQIDRGTLDMRMAGAAGLSVSMNKERRSSFKSDFPFTMNSSNEDKIEGTINGGGPRLTLHTDRTQVHLRN